MTNPRSAKRLIAGLRLAADLLEIGPEIPGPELTDVMLFVASAGLRAFARFLEIRSEAHLPVARVMAYALMEV